LIDWPVDGERLDYLAAQPSNTEGFSPSATLFVEIIKAAQNSSEE
jgi:hypothetical protein